MIDKLPTALLILDAENSEHLDLLERFRKRYEGKIRTIVASSTFSNVSEFDEEQVVKGDLRYLYHLRNAPYLIVLEECAKITRYNYSQRCFAIITSGQYQSRGIQLKQLRPDSPVFDPTPREVFAYGFVYQSQAEEKRIISNCQVSFLQVDGLKSVFSSFIREFDAVYKSASRKINNYYVFSPRFDSLKQFPEEVKSYLAAAISQGNAGVVVITNAPSQQVFESGFPHTQVISDGQFQKVFSIDDLSDDDIVIYYDFADLVRARIHSHRPIYVYAENLPLLYSRPNIGHLDFKALAADPFAFYKANLDRIYVERGCASRSVSIIIPHYNTGIEKIARCLRSAIDCRNYHPSVDIILIDDGSTDDISSDINQTLGDEWLSVRYIRKDNEGQGPTRNCGVRESKSDYVFFLDSDDEIVSENLKYLVAHAEYTGAGLVTGKRILCDLDGSFLSDSLDYTFRSIARTVTSRTVNIYDDHMANNRLIRREDFLANSLWFDAGFYEDNAFAAKLYGAFERIEFLNFPIHRWYQYDIGESTTKTASFRHISDKLNSLEQSWRYLADTHRRVRIKYNLNVDLPHFLAMASQLSSDDYLSICNRTRAYIANREMYVEKKHLNKRGLKLLVAIERDQPIPMGCGFNTENRSIPARHVFFPRTHFQVLQALAFTLDERVPSVLVIAENIPGFRKDFINRIVSTGVFDEVIPYSNNAVYDCLRDKLRLGSGAGGVIFNTLFKSFDISLPGIREGDIGIFFLEGWPERYFIGRKFRTIYKMEDGYCSTNREFTLDRVDGIWGVNRVKNGIWGQINILTQLAYDNFHHTRSRVSKLIVSAQPDMSLLTGDYASTEVVVKDFKETALKHRDEVLAALENLYGRIEDLEQDATIVLTQPLFFDFCTMEEHIALAAHLIDRVKTAKVYIKPHPMDPCDYSVLGHRILPTTVPFEYYEVKGRPVDRAITFGSSALENSRMVGQVEYLFPRQGFTADEVREEIRRICYDEGAIHLANTKLLVEAWEATRTAPVSKTPTVAAPVSKTPTVAAIANRSRLTRKAKTALRLLISDRREFVRATRVKLARMLQPA